MGNLPLANPTHFHPVPTEHKVMWIQNAHAAGSPFCQHCDHNQYSPDFEEWVCTLDLNTAKPTDCTAYEVMNPFNYFNEETGERYHD